MKETQAGNNAVDDIEAIAERAEAGEDISEHFTGQFSAKQQASIDFPLSLLKAIDAECRRVGVTRQLGSRWLVTKGYGKFKRESPVNSSLTSEYESFMIPQPPKPPLDANDQGVIEFYLGADGLGRDILLRLLFGARISIAVESCL